MVATTHCLRDTNTTTTPTTDDGTHLKRPPLAVLDAHQLVREAQLLGELLQQVDAEARAALVEGAVAVRGELVNPAGGKATFIVMPVRE